ncbi:MAG: hypothetical protein FJ279_04045 [Planctomycetes bacterium]|nr:hypothetical protein [Planctomycetota bacterium]MBM4086837.1 hypothetical protein [Planctomycetota bacterium]
MAIVLPVRYCELNAPTGVPWTEDRFDLKTLTWRIKPREAALVMVDVWDIHPYESHLKRGAEITQERSSVRAAGRMPGSPSRRPSGATSG